MDLARKGMKAGSIVEVAAEGGQRFVLAPLTAGKRTTFARTVSID